jgi:FG-GAP repeat
VANAGDLNGDGRSDFLIGAPDADSNGREDSGSAYIRYPPPCS